MGRSIVVIDLQRMGKDSEAANPGLICRLSSGLVFLCKMQFLHGYCILKVDPMVDSINSLALEKRTQFLCDMALVGDAILEVTGAYRINYALMGNSDPILHAHIVPRYKDEAEELRKGLPWSYPNINAESTQFDLQRDAQLIFQLRQNIQKRIHICNKMPFFT
jgi:diadenosine tetraphosphate (Ap4A) HIT family hydrolase